MAQDNFMYEWKQFKEHYDVLEDGSIKIHDNAPIRIKDSYKLYYKLMNKVNTFASQKTSLFSMPNNNKKAYSNPYLNDDKLSEVTMKAILDFDTKKRIATYIMKDVGEKNNETKINKCTQLPFWSAINDSKEVGFVCLNKLHEASVEIYAIAVLSQYQQTKIGTQLLKECESWCNENNIKLIKAIIGCDQDKTLYKFYSKNGFHCLEKHIDKDSSESLIMIKAV